MHKPSLLLGLATSVSLFATSAMAQVSEGYSGHPQMWGHGGGSGYGGHFFIPLIGIIVVVLIVMAVVRMMGCAGHRCGHHRGGSSALALLEERFAKGEIDKAEFEERRTTLKS